MNKLTLASFFEGRFGLMFSLAIVIFVFLSHYIFI